MPNGAVRRALRKTAPVRRTERSISERASGSGGAAAGAGASAQDDGVSIIVRNSLTNNISPHVGQPF